MSTDSRIRYVVIHQPGAAWVEGVDPREQPGMEHHVRHYAGLFADGRLDLGGPFLDPDTGGMMVAAAGVPKEDLDVFAAADPAVAAGLLEYEIREWYVPMSRYS